MHARHFTFAISSLQITEEVFGLIFTFLFLDNFRVTGELPK